MTSPVHPMRAVERCEQLARLGPPPPWWRVFAVRRWLRDYRAATALDISVNAELLRELYPAERIAELAHRPNTALLPFIRKAQR